MCALLMSKTDPGQARAIEPSEASLYQPLGQSGRQFRLLRLRGSDADQIQCEMKTFSLASDDLPPWKALSYRWGEDEPDFVIRLNGHPVPVRKGLRLFLRQMMVEKRQDWCFVDALCIDQNNDREKARQVMQMCEIYQRAEEVVAWIVYEPYHYEGDRRNSLESGPVYDPDEDAYDTSSFSRTQLETAVLENTYWTRLWILQEVLLAKRLTIRIGNAEVEWTNLLPEKPILNRGGRPTRNQNIHLQAVCVALYTICSFLGRNANPSQFRQTDTQLNVNRRTARKILSHRRAETEDLRAGSHIPFHVAVDFFSLQRCTRPHDAVFGYIGLTDSRILIDYSVSILDLFVATLADYLLSAGYITQQLTPIQFARVQRDTAIANDIIAPLLAFKLDPCHPVVQLLLLEVTKFFAPGFEVELTETATMTWWNIHHFKHLAQEIKELALREHRFELRYIGPLCVKFVKIVASEVSAWAEVEKAIAARQKALEEEDAVMAGPLGASDEFKTYSQWAAHARTISAQIWQRSLHGD
jgi:hypothetical protein